jgi:hypothetical protein
VNGVGQIVGGAGQTVGRYFSVVSVLPSAVLVMFAVALVTSGAWSGPPNWSATIVALGDISVAGYALIALASIILGLALHGLQFALLQILEGYWGTRPVLQELRQWRMAQYVEFVSSLRRPAVSIRSMLKGEVSDAQQLMLSSWAAELDREAGPYSKRRNRIMPTRLGNVLRKYEDAAGAPYNLSVIAVFPYLMMVAPPEQVAYLRDRRSQLDLAVQMTLTFILACSTAALFLWNDGLWLLLALIPYALCYLSYRGAVVLAGHYGSAFSVLLALNRFALYEQLRLTVPKSATEERIRNKDLRRFVEHFDPDVRVFYSDPPGPPEGTITVQAKAPE